MAATPPIAPPAIAPVWDDLDGELVTSGCDVESVVEDESREVAVGLDVAADEPPDGLNSAASDGFEDRNPAVRFTCGQPFCMQGLDLQQPMNGGAVVLQVYQSPAEHC